MTTICQIDRTIPVTVYLSTLHSTPLIELQLSNKTMKQWRSLLRHNLSFGLIAKLNILYGFLWTLHDFHFTWNSHSFHFHHTSKKINDLTEYAHLIQSIQLCSCSTACELVQVGTSTATISSLAALYALSVTMWPVLGVRLLIHGTREAVATSKRLRQRYRYQRVVPDPDEDDGECKWIFGSFWVWVEPYLSLL